jgi:hypothetical protein
MIVSRHECCVRLLAKKQDENFSKKVPKNYGPPLPYSIQYAAFESNDIIIDIYNLVVMGGNNDQSVVLFASCVGEYDENNLENMMLGRSLKAEGGRCWIGSNYSVWMEIMW